MVVVKLFYYLMGKCYSSKYSFRSKVINTSIVLYDKIHPTIEKIKLILTIIFNYNILLIVEKSISH
jgi:hypothetical protein